MKTFDELAQEAEHTLNPPPPIKPSLVFSLYDQCGDVSDWHKPGADGQLMSTKQFRSVRRVQHRRFDAVPVVCFEDRTSTWDDDSTTINAIVCYPKGKDVPKRPWKGERIPRWKVVLVRVWPLARLEADIREIVLPESCSGPRFVHEAFDHTNWIYIAKNQRVELRVNDEVKHIWYGPQRLDGFSVTLDLSP